MRYPRMASMVRSVLLSNRGRVAVGVLSVSACTIIGLGDQRGWSSPSLDCVRRLYVNHTMCRMECGGPTAADRRTCIVRPVAARSGRQPPFGSELSVSGR